MILSDKQLTISVRELNRLQGDFERFEFFTPEEIAENKAQMNALSDRIAKLKEDIRAYRSLRRGTVNGVKCEGLEDFAQLLIKARIISRMTQSQLARAIGVQPQQIQRYESTEYAGVGLKKAIQIARTLGVKVVAEFDLREARYQSQLTR